MSAAAALLLAALVFDANAADTVETWQLAHVEHAFGFVNDSAHPVTIAAASALDPTATATFEPATVPAGGRGVVRVRQPVGLRLGVARFGFDVRTAGATAPPQRLTLTTFVQSAYDTERPFVDFGSVHRDTGQTTTVEVASREIERLALVAVVDSPDFLQVQGDAPPPLPGAALRVGITIAPGAPLGFHVGAVHLRTNVPHQPDYVVGVQAAVYGDIVPVEPGGGLVRLGALQAGRPQTRITRLQSRSGRRFIVETVEDPTGRATVASAPCTDDGPPDAARPATAPCWQLEVQFPALVEGPFETTLHARIAGEVETIPLMLAGLVVPAGTRVESLGTLGSETDIRERQP